MADCGDISPDFFHLSIELRFFDSFVRASLHVVVCMVLLRKNAGRMPALQHLLEEGLEDLRAVVEDAADVGSDEEGIDEGAAEYGVVDVVGDLGAAVLRDEAMFVAPEAIRAVELFVDKAVRGIPGGDFAFPGNGDAVEAEFVANVRAGAHFDWIGSYYPKF